MLARLAERAEVVAVYHPKPPRDVGFDEVREAARRIGMPGRLGVDREWAVLDRWKPPEERRFTSLTFLVDRRGRVRHVHAGGRLTAEDEEDLGRRIEALMAEKE